MKTKERILLKSLELFNKEGLSEVTLRRIAVALDISQGNLSYHFKTKAEIIGSLYNRLVEEMNTEMQKIAQEQPILSYLEKSSRVSMETLFAYRFILRDLYKVLETDKELKKHYLELQKTRGAQFSLLFQNLVKEGLMRPEELDGEFDRLHERMNILGDNWINAADFFSTDDKTKVAHYHSLLFEVIYPYLTKKGKEEYLGICINS